MTLHGSLKDLACTCLPQERVKRWGQRLGVSDGDVDPLASARPHRSARAARRANRLRGSRRRGWSVGGLRACESFVEVGMG
jgi:hypothetical protein